MSYHVRFTAQARSDIERLYGFLLKENPLAAESALETIERGFRILEQFPFACRKAAHTDPRFRELLISFGRSGYVALFEIEDSSTVTVLAVRHQREDDFIA